MPDEGAVRSAEVQARRAPEPRLAEAAGLLAVATDMATGMPLTTTLRICLAGQRIAELLDDDSLDRRALYYYTLVRLLGCTVETSRFAGAMGNEIEIGKVMVPVDQGSPREMLPMMLRTVGAGESPCGASAWSWPPCRLARTCATCLPATARCRACSPRISDSAATSP